MRNKLSGCRSGDRTTQAPSGFPPPGGAFLFAHSGCAKRRRGIHTPSISVQSTVVPSITTTGVMDSGPAPSGASRNDDETYFHILATAFVRGLPFRSLPRNKRAQGRPGARCTRGLVCNVHQKKTHTSIQVKRKHSGLPCAMARRLIRALPGDRAFLPPSPAWKIPRGLTPASGRQDHTTSPYAPRHSSCDTTRPSLPAPNVS